MIRFNTNHLELYNYIIHRFLKMEVFSEDEDLEFMIDCLIPNYLRREQYAMCEKKFKELYEWTKIEEEKDMTPFHEIILYEFISYMSCIQKDEPDFHKIYFDDKFNSLVEEASKEDYEECCDDKEMTIEFLKNWYYDIYGYVDDLFEDLDFLDVVHIYNSRNTGNTNLEDMLRISLDHYYEIMPLDIQKKYKSSHLNLICELSNFLDYVEDRIENGSLMNLFWEKDLPVNESKVRLILDNIMTAYYCNQEVEMLWESKVKEDIIDFEVYRRRQKEKVLLELRRENKDYLIKGYEKYLLNKIDKNKYKNAYFVILCFTEEEYAEINRFINEFETFTLNLNIRIFDLRKRESASKRKKIQN